MRRAAALRALRHRSFRLFFLGQGISIIGTWVQTIALSWLMYRLTGSTTLLGLTTFLSQAPVLFIGPFSGWLGDHYDRRRLLIATQALLLVQALCLGILVLAGWSAPPLLLGMAALQGVLGGLDTPIRQSFLGEMVPDKTDLPNAIALNSFLMNGGRLLGPMVAGLLLAQVSEGVCFLVNAASYAAVVGAVLAMKVPTALHAQHAHRRDGSRWIDALRYAWATPVIRNLLPLVMATSFFASPYVTLMPAIARDVFGGGPGTLGLLVGCAGLGGVTATALLATRTGIAGLERWTLAACAGAGLCLAAFSFTTILPLALPLMVGVGAGIIGTAASVNMQLQTQVDDQFRGRMISLYVMAFLGLAPFGGLWAGYLADRTGAPVTLAIGGVACLVAALSLGRRVAVTR
ncbi:MAG: MFS transporter [Burkholderiales bacterium]|nr:MFS transporter [Burkholderiales bacterium]